MAKAQPQKPKNELTPEELKALEALEADDVEVVASMEVRNAETETNELEVEKKRKEIEKPDVQDPIKRRELRR